MEQQHHHKLCAPQNAVGALGDGHNGVCELGDSAFRHRKHRAEGPGHLEGSSKMLYLL